MTIRIKRVYVPASDGDGMRILVDRVWPRGVSHQKAHIHFWDKEIAPSTVLRKWFDHKVERWAEFQRRYRAELRGNPALDDLKKLTRGKQVTLVYGARDEEHNQAVTLCAVLGGAAAKRKNPPRKTKPGSKKPGARKTKRRAAKR